MPWWIPSFAIAAAPFATIRGPSSSPKVPILVPATLYDSRPLSTYSGSSTF